MESYEGAFLNLEINMKKPNLTSSKKIKRLKNYLILPDYLSSQIKAYSFFKTIEEKERKNKELSTKKNNNEINTKKDDLRNLLKGSIENYKNKKNVYNYINETRGIYNSIKNKKMFDEIRRKTPKNIKFDKKHNLSLLNSAKKDKIKENNNNYTYLFFKNKLNLNISLINNNKKNKIIIRNSGYDKFDINNRNRQYSYKKIYDKEIKEKESKSNNENKKISSSYDWKNKINNNYLNSPKNLKINKNRLLTIERNILNTIKINNMDYTPSFKRKNQIIRIKKFNKPNKNKFLELLTVRNKSIKNKI